MLQFDVYKCFMPKCFLDTNLVEVLLEKTNAVNHKKGNSPIAVAISNERLKGKFVVGVIDDDKIKLKELDNFNFIERLSKEGLKFYKHPNQQHYFIQISPAIEKWLLNECFKGGLNLNDYGLPNTFNEFKRLKATTQRDDIRFRNLFKDMLKTEGCDEMIELKRWLTFLRANNNNSNIELL